MKGYQCKEPNHFRIFLCNQKNPVKCSTCVVSKKIAIERGIAFSEIRVFLENHVLEFYKICHENTSGPGEVLGISSDGDDQMEPKVKTQKNP